MATVEVGPGQTFTSIQAAVNANPAGTTFDILPGTYYESITPKNGDVFLGHSGTVLDGGGGTTEHHAFNGAGVSNVVVNGLTIQHWVDSSNPNIETGVFGTGSWVNTPGWVIENCDISFNTGAGIDTGNNMMILNNSIHDNTLLGIRGSEDSTQVTISNNDIFNNNTAQSVPYSSTGFAAGIKLFQVTNYTITNNTIHDNYGLGLWLDTNFNHITVTGNEIYNQHELGGPSVGIYWEAGMAGGSATDNLISGNYIHGNDNGIDISTSGDTTITGNVITASQHTINMWEQSRGADSNGVPYTTSNLDIEHNWLGYSQGSVSGVDQNGYGNWQHQNVVFDNNTYYVAGTPSDFTINGTTTGQAGWQAAGHDVHSTFSNNGGLIPSTVVPTIGATGPDPSTTTNPPVASDPGGGVSGSSLPPSPDGTVVIGTAGDIITAAGNDYAIDAAGQITKNGVVLPITDAVTELAYVNGTLYQEATANHLWWSYNEGADQWTMTSNPLPSDPPPTSPPPTSPPPTDTGGTAPTPSPDGTVVIGTNGDIVSNSGNTYAIDAAGQITKNGAVLPITESVTELAYVNGTLYQEATSANHWWSYNESTDVWTTTNNPLATGTTTASDPPPQPSPDGTVVIGTNGDIVTSSGNTYAIDSAGQITKNGAVLPITKSVTELAYVNGTLYQEATAGHHWWSYNESTDHWTVTKDPLTGGTPVHAASAAVVVAAPSTTLAPAATSTGTVDTNMDPLELVTSSATTTASPSTSSSWAATTTPLTSTSPVDHTAHSTGHDTAITLDSIVPQTHHWAHLVH